jgi:hypothetical protein
LRVEVSAFVLALTLTLSPGERGQLSSIAGHSFAIPRSAADLLIEVRDGRTIKGVVS